MATLGVKGMVQVVKSGKGLRGDDMGMMDYKKSRKEVRSMQGGGGASSSSDSLNRGKTTVGNFVSVSKNDGSRGVGGGTRGGT
eukprot:CAMPEP_0181130328 /NCGR_PEP_ID=MMETSP1071-20121207/29802_1 /TAXON_ID=35127 /ORGANISM="Thalassiosira sp., Strain NH16" /LENGTH=82 /DNA_ID=CAMNT_0023216385 /DNA_START=164 /DNA_END=413 /DNA_ORIENTATION=+